MPVSSQVQTGSVNFTVTDVVKNITITSTVLARSMVTYTHKTADGGGRANKTLFRAELTSTTNLRLTRNTSSFATSTDVEWVVTEFASGEASIQTGSVNPTADPTDISLTAVSLTKAFPVIFYGSDLATGFDNTTTVRPVLTSTTNLRLDFEQAPGTGDFDMVWQVIEFPSNCTVQTGEKIYSHASGSATQAITAVNRDKTLLLNFSTGLAGSNYTSRTKVRSRLTDGSTITFDNTETAGTPNNITNQWYVIEFTDSTSVQYGANTLATTVGTANATLTAVVLARSQVWNGCSWQNSKTDETTSEDRVVCTQKLTSTTNLEIKRQVAVNAVDVSWFVIQWAAAITFQYPQTERSIRGLKRGVATGAY